MPHDAAMPMAFVTSQRESQSRRTRSVGARLRGKPGELRWSHRTALAPE
ncbi:MAG: hypothetical protein KME38_13575 [Spirirestis rafaelensis WJT71-NPBG6]|nr:hypothetical protein [Spirirestis rafaelensis WJT71-NPBG6]